MRKQMVIGVMAAVMLMCGGCASVSKPIETTEAAGSEAPSAEPGKEEGKKTALQEELLVSVWAGPHADLQKTTIADSYEANKVTVDDVDYGNLKQKQLTSFQAAPGTGNYDVVWVNSQWMKEYVDEGYLLPLDDQIKKAGIDTGMYSSGLMDGCVFDGKVYGLPTYAQTLILVYDSEVFDQEGIAVPANVEELITVAKYFKEKGSGIAIPAKQGSASSTLFSQLLYSDDGYFFDKSGSLDLTSEACVYAANVYDQLAQYSVDGCLAWHHDEVAEAVRMKEAPIGIVMSGLANQNSDPEKSLIVDTVRYAPLSGKNGKAAASNSFWVWAIAKNSAKPEAAFDLCTWITSPEIEKLQTLADQQISAVDALANDAEVVEKTPYLPVVMEQLSNGKIDPVLENWGTLKEALIVGLSEIASTDAKPEDVLAKIQAEMESVDFSK